MKRGLFTVIIFLIIFQAVAAASGGIEKGLSFRSYEVAPNLRTSLAIPAGKDSRIRFNKQFTLAFDLRIDTARECFGYVCRIVVDGIHNIDLILSNPVRGIPYLGLTTASGELEALRLGADGGIGSWNRIEIGLVTDGTSLAVSANGTGVDTLRTDSREHSAVVLFGANSRDVFATSDVAPMTLRNVTLALRDPQKPEFRWELGHEDDLAGSGSSLRNTIDIRNPEWLSQRHSRWRKTAEFSFTKKVFPVLDPFRSRILFVSADRVMVLLPREGKVSEYLFSQNMRPDLITNDFIVLPDGRLIYYDLEHAQPVICEFDFTRSRWQRSVERTSHSKYLHHNKFFNPLDSSVVQLFGYGFHRYLNEAVAWRIGTDSVRRFSLEQIEPRYLSAVGIADSCAYIYGGKGNEKGIQEFGATIYNDLYRLDLRDYSLCKLWDDPQPGQRVAASNLVIDPRGEKFTALFYSPNSYRSQLQLLEYALANGHNRLLADTIPYDFLDIDSDAGLLFDRQAAAYHAVVTGKGADGNYHTTVYSISTPVLEAAAGSPTAGRGYLRYLLPIALFIAVAAAIVAILQRRKRSLSLKFASREPTVEISSQKEPGIYLSGGFRVIDRMGNDITANFTPVMRQLLVLIILYSYKQKGISNAELKEALWSDKSDESYYNNRGVNLRKIRTWLTEVGTVEIVSANGYWSVACDTSLCDYIRHNGRMDAVDPHHATADDLQALILIARSGTLLPDMRFEWTDRFKAAYTDRIIELLGSIRDQAQQSFSPETCIRLADAILLFDSLDEDSIRVKCRALIALKRPGIAQNVFSSFTQEYRRLMGEEYGVSFDKFIK